MNNGHIYDSEGRIVPENHKASSAMINTIDTMPKASYTAEEVRGIMDSMEFRCARSVTRQVRMLEALTERNFQLEELIRKIKSV